MSCENNSTIQSKINVIGSISGSQLTLDFEQANHGFRVGDVVRYDDAYGGFTLAQADTAENAEVTGIIRELQGDSKVFMVIEGIIPIGGFTFARDPNATLGSWTGYTASTYFLSGTTAGLLDSIPPKENGSIIKPTMINMGTIGTEQYGIVKNFVGNQIGGNASAGVHGISPVGSIVPYVGYSTNVPSGFTSCKGGFISPSIYTKYNTHIGGKFGYKMRIGITGDQTQRSSDNKTPTDLFVEELYNELLGTQAGATLGIANDRKPRFRQEFPGRRPKWENRQGLSPDQPTQESDIFVIQGDVVGISQPFDGDTITSHGPYWIDVEVTPDNQLDLPRLLWAEKYGNDAYAGVAGERSTNFVDHARYGRPTNDEGLKPIIRSSFMANYALEEAVDISESNDDSFGFGRGKRTKIFRQDNTGDHGYVNGLLEANHQVDESHFNSYTQEQNVTSNDKLYGDASSTSSPRKINTALTGNEDNIASITGLAPLHNGLVGENGGLLNAPNYDSPRPHNEREIVSYISETIGAPLPFNKSGDNGTAQEDYDTGVRTYIILKSSDDGFIDYKDLNKRVGDINKGTVTEYIADKGFAIFEPTQRNVGYVKEYRTFLLNTSNGTEGSGVGNEIDTISLEGIGVPDLRDRYLKGPVEPDDIIGDYQKSAHGAENFIEKDAYSVMSEYDGGVGIRGGTNRTHSQKLLSVSHLSSPSNTSLEEHRRHLELYGVDGYDSSDYNDSLGGNLQCAPSGNMIDIWMDVNLSCWGDPADNDGDVKVWPGLYRHNEFYHVHTYTEYDNMEGTLLGIGGMRGPTVTHKSLGYGRVVGDDGLYNTSGIYLDDRGNTEEQKNNVILPWNRDRYHRVDTPGIVTDTVYTPRKLRDENGVPTSLDEGGLYLRDDFSNHKDYNVISRDGGSQGSLYGWAGFGYHPIMGIDPQMTSQYNDLLSGAAADGFAVPQNTPDQGAGTYFGDDYETYAYITNQPKYFSVNWLIRIEDDTAVALVDDTTFRKINVDGINDDGTTLSSGSPLNLTNLPTSDPSVAGAVWNDGGTLKVSSG